MNLRSSILNIGLLILLLILLIFTIINYKVLSANEGWGIVGVIGIGAWTLGGFLLELVIRNISKNETLKFILRLVVLGFYIFLYGSFFMN